jgi:hypothetical protein
MARVAAAAALAPLLAVAFVVSASAAASQNVTLLDVRRYWSAECNCFKLDFSGRISNGAADEYVAIVQQKCGQNFSTSVGGTSTVHGGSWLVEVGLPFSGNSATYRARWGGHLSEPWTFRPEILVWPVKRIGRRFAFSLYADYPDQRMRGRVVELQRLAAGRWTRVRRARLVRAQRSFSTFSATFTVRRRGLTLRVAVPEETAAPCYTANVTQTFRS